MVWIDTHCHLDATEFSGQIEKICHEAVENDVRVIVVPSVSRRNFEQVEEIAYKYSIPGKFEIFFTLGIHPLYVPDAHIDDLDHLKKNLERQIDKHESRLIGVGEIGLDLFVPNLKNGVNYEKQIDFYRAQLKLASEFELPVILHVRKSSDLILKFLRKVKISSGIAHAFNGSDQQADIFSKLNIKLGFGGAMTFSRALQIRRLASELPIKSIVLETDAPDIPPAWIDKNQFNSPRQLSLIAAEMARIRGLGEVELASEMENNFLSVFPRAKNFW